MERGRRPLGDVKMTTYYAKLDGCRIVSGRVLVVDGRRIRFHGARKWGGLYWSCAASTAIWRDSLRDAYESAMAVCDLDILAHPEAAK